MMPALANRERRYRVAIVAACPFRPCRLAAAGSPARPRPARSRPRHGRGHLCRGAGARARGIPVRRIPRHSGIARARLRPRVAKLVLDAALLLRLLHVLRRESVEVMHAHNYEAALIGLAARHLTGVPLIYHSHNALAEELPTYFRSRTARRLARFAGAIADREVPRRADHCIAICRELVGFLRARGVEEEAIEMIAPGDRPRSSRHARRRGATIRACFGFGERPLLLYTGNLDGYQNLELLLASIGIVRRTIGDALLCWRPMRRRGICRRICAGCRLVSVWSRPGISRPSAI